MTMRASLALAGLLILTALPWSIPASGDPNGGQLNGDPVRGAKFYSDNCGRCHNARAAVEHRDRDWSIVITHMRITAGLPGQQARDIYAFIRESNNPPRTTARVAPAAVEKLSGAQMLDRYGCRGCHTIRGAGGTIAPNLQGVFERREEEWIRVQIQRPQEHNPRTVMPTFGLTDDQVGAIIESLRSAQ
jgi:mono/diheme cytochrome c family protein